MLSKLIPKLNIMDHQITAKVTKKQNTPRPGDKMKVYTAEVMSKIPFAEATIKTVSTKGNKIFLNDPECRPSVKTSVKTQNYLTVVCGKNANWDGIDTVVKSGNGRIVSRTIPKGLEIQASFLGGLLTHGIVETKRDLTSYGGSKKAENTSMIYSGDIGHVHVSDPKEIAVLSNHVDDLITKLQDSKILGNR